ncbi:hypothetical protein GCM10010282_30030 [Streptomyces roseolus]|nr:hypothetical protein GCM10010282_30030 [Streptomyces roseolus]
MCADVERVSMDTGLPATALEEEAVIKIPSAFGFQKPWDVRPEASRWPTRNAPRRARDTFLSGGRLQQ